MFLPIGDTPNPRDFTPWVTWLIIAINVAVHLLVALPLSVSAPDVSDPVFVALVERLRAALPPGAAVHVSAWDVFVEVHGFKPGAPSALDLLTAMFLHSNLAHLGGNMLFLGIYGDNVEHRLGRLGYLATYLGTGAAATLAFSLVAPDPMTPLVGASGAISGLLGAYFVMFPRNLVKIFVFFFVLVDIWLVPAPFVLGAYLLVDNLLPFLVGGSSGVAYGAHLGGFVSGLGVAWISERLLARDHPRVPHGSPAAVRAARWIEAGDRLAAAGQPSAAFQHYLRALGLAESPELRDAELAEAARDGLRKLPLDPRLAARLGL